MTLGREWLALLLLVGTIVGVGMFGIPFQFARAGFITGAIELAVLAAAATIIHLAYAQVVLSTQSLHRLPGYVSLYLGRAAGWISRTSYLFGLSGTLLAYLVLGGFFLGTIIQWAFPTAPSLYGPLAFYILGVGIIFRSLRFESLANALLTFALIIAIAVLALTLLPASTASFLTTFRRGGIFIPYGVILFSLSGAAIIPDCRRLFDSGHLASLGRIIIVGTIFSALLYLIFAAAVVGALGDRVSPDAISGLAEQFGRAYLIAGSLIGFLATITSFITLGLVFKGMFVSDFRIRASRAWFLVSAIPVVLYFLGFQDFIAIISMVGAVAIGLDSIFILLVHRRAALAQDRLPELRIPIPGFLRLVLILIFSGGMTYELFSYFR